MNKPEDSIYQLKPYQLEGINYAIPTNSSPEFRRHIAAAVLAYKEDNLHFRDMDVRLDVMDITKFSDSNQGSKMDVIQDAAIKVVDSTKQELEVFARVDDNMGHKTFYIALGRLNATFQSAVVLLRYGYFIEVSALFRIIFEQICWANFVVDKSEEIISRQKVTKTVSNIKEIDNKYPRWYSDLSNEAHIDFKIIADYLYFDDDQFGFVIRSGEKSKEKTQVLLLLSKMYIETLCVCIKNKLELGDDEKETLIDSLELKMSVILELIDVYEKGGEKCRFRYDERI